MLLVSATFDQDVVFWLASDHVSAVSAKGSHFNRPDAVTPLVQAVALAVDCKRLHVAATAPMQAIFAAPENTTRAADAVLEAKETAPEPSAMR